MRSIIYPWDLDTPEGKRLRREMAKTRINRFHIGLGLAVWFIWVFGAIQVFLGVALALHFLAGVAMFNPFTSSFLLFSLLTSIWTIWIVAYASSHAKKIPENLGLIFLSICLVFYLGLVLTQAGAYLGAYLALMYQLGAYGILCWLLEKREDSKNHLSRG